MSIVKSSRGKDKLLLEGYSYQRANNSQNIWRYSRNNCAGRVKGDGDEYITITEHVHTPNPDENISTVVSGRAKPKRRIKYELMDERLQLLVSTFYVTPLDIYLKRAQLTGAQLSGSIVAGSTVVLPAFNIAQKIFDISNEITPIDPYSKGLFYVNVNISDEKKCSSFKKQI